jgi:CheY-like chemotaxis protein
VDAKILDGLTILVADDNEYNRIVARDTLLSKANVTIIEAENGQEAVDRLTEKVDVILMDAQMPILSGFDATRKIRAMANEKMSQIPVIALTASVLRTDLDRCKDAGMNGYIPKPFKTHELIVGIAEVLNIKLKLNTEKKEEVQKVSTNSSLDTVTDLNYLREFCEGDEGKMQKYIDMFLKSAPTFLEKLDELIKAKDAEGIANQVHGFKTKLTMMGMKETKELSVIIENSLRDEGTIASINDEIKTYLSQIKMGVDELA